MGSCMWLQPWQSGGRQVVTRRLEQVHEVVEAACAVNNIARRAESIYLNTHSVDCALLAAGSCIDAVAAVAAGLVDASFVLARPPGHHAENSSMKGFCLFNNASVAVASALADGVKRVLLIDWDVHHGNGSQHIFEDDDRVLFVSLHRYDDGTFYPAAIDGAPTNVGRGRGAGYTVNIGWDGPGAGDAE
eukprot:CAMPEP_0197393494 /NCGR_PEP_ID=MMETSP1165-20131217/4349_1 /TAXON_ID=284809 /ORGANISM="Chrysocystis fragilis, Strain CCMP3189" /LENGTH=188 /DNA_ID=CAMNT_0042919159 /DNA_START=732 /DNA_END=1298 /DNA_ORIENTATION=-